jgi:hypothetical protein
MLSACVGGKAIYLYMLLNFLVLGLIIQPIVMGFEECQAACLSCAPACPACCRDNTCSCDYIQFLFFSFVGMMQIGTIVFGCSLINSADSRWDDAYSRSGEAEGTPYLRFEGATGFSSSPPHANGKTFPQIRRRLSEQRFISRSIALMRYIQVLIQSGLGHHLADQGACWLRRAGMIGEREDSPSACGIGGFDERPIAAAAAAVLDVDLAARRQKLAEEARAAAGRVFG